MVEQSSDSPVAELMAQQPEQVVIWTMVRMRDRRVMIAVRRQVLTEGWTAVLVLDGDRISLAQFALMFVISFSMAYQSGQVLPAVFVLRTLLEQWARTGRDETLRADQAIEEYMASLPDDFPSRFATVRKVYGDLGDAVHRASEDPALFDSALKTIVEHFEARQLFKL